MESRWLSDREGKDEIGRQDRFRVPAMRMKSKSTNEVELVVGLQIC